MPFGMMFEEKAHDHSQDLLAVTYDSIEGISFVIEAGQRVPFVEWSHVHLGTKTGDTTKATIDSTDTDPQDD
jgi:hypothetical protein